MHGSGSLPMQGNRLLSDDLEMDYVVESKEESKEKSKGKGTG